MDVSCGKNARERMRRDFVRGMANMHIDAYAPLCIKSRNEKTGGRVVALGDAILACLTERPMTGYELAKTFDSSIGFFWKADHQQIYRELSKLRDRGHVQGRA